MAIAATYIPTPPTSNEKGFVVNCRHSPFRWHVSINKGKELCGVHIISTTNLAACVCAQNLTNFCPHAFISSPNVPKILFA